MSQYLILYPEYDKLEENDAGGYEPLDEPIGYLKSYPEYAKSEENDASGYEPLDESIGEIRLVRFRRIETRSFSRRAPWEPLTEIKKSHPEIRCEKFAVGMRPPYIALSYCWGSTESRETFTINGTMIRVTANLAQYIEYTTPKMPRLWSPYIWIDALCINQNDVVERNRQVLKMKQIFEEAESVLAWLGCADMQVEDAIRHLADSTRRLSLTKTDKFFGSHSRQRLDSLVNAIYCNPWWTRAWIIQEATTPGDRDLMILYGNCRVGLNILVEELKEILHSHFPDLNKQENVSKIPALQILELARMRQERIDRKAKAGAPKQELLKLLEAAKYHYATDDRDKVYSVLALSEDVDGSVLQPNYALSVLEVYRNTATYILKNQKNLNLLYYSSGFGNIAAGWPSWVPTWRPEFDLPFWKLHHYRASDSEVSFCDVVDDSVLVVDGSILDHIIEVGLPRTSNVIDDEVERDWKSIAYSKRMALVYQEQTEDLQKAFTRTLCADLAHAQDLRAGRGERGCTCGSLSAAEPQRFFLTHQRNFVTTGRQFFVTSKGYMGLGQSSTMRWNSAIPWSSYKLCIISGFPIPVLLLELDNANQFHFICTCYVDGIMDGQACKMEGFKQNLKRIEIL